MKLSSKVQAISPSPTLVVDSKAKEMISRGLDVVSFGAGEPDFDTPLHIREAAASAMAAGHTRYTPAAGTIELREAVCEKLQKDNGLEYGPKQIIISNGGKQALYNALCTILNPGDEVLIPAPYWVSYPEMVRLGDGVPVFVPGLPENDMKVTARDLEAACTQKTRAMILNSPGNPTGQVYNRAELESLAQFCLEKEIFIISDEIYEKLIYGGEAHVSIASLGAGIKDLTVLVNGVSKSHAMTGWRIGYAAAPAPLAAAMDALQSHTTGNPNSIAQKATLAALRGPGESLEEMHRAFEERRRYIFKRARDIPGLEPLEPKGAFYLFASVEAFIGRLYRGRKVESGDHFTEMLLEEEMVALVQGSAFGTPPYVRLSFATSMEKIKEGLDRLARFVGEME